MILQQLLIEGGILALLIQALGGNDMEIGIAVGSFSFAKIIQLFISPHIDVNRTKRIVFWGLTSSVITACFILLFLPIRNWTGAIFDIATGDTIARWYVIVTVCFYFILMQVGVSAWFPFLAQILPPQLRGRYFGTMRSTWQFTTLIFTLIAARMLSKEPQLADFYPVLLMGMALHIIRLFFISRLPDPPPARSGKPEKIIQNFLRPAKDSQFIWFVAFIMILFGLRYTAIAFATPFLAKELAFGDELSVYTASIRIAGCLLSLIIWGKMTDRWGTRMVFILSIALCGIGIGLVAFIPAWPTPDNTAMLAFASLLAVLAFLLQGLGIAGIDIAWTVRLIHQAPAKYRGSYIVFAIVAIGLTGGVTPLISGATLDYITAFYGNEILVKQFFFIIVMLLLLSSTLILPKLKPIREPHAQMILRGFINAIPNSISTPLLFVTKHLRNRDPNKYNNG